MREKTVSDGYCLRKDCVKTESGVKRTKKELYYMK